MHRTRLRVVPLFLALAAAAAPARAFDSGTGLYGLHVGHGTADLYYTTGPYVSAYEHSELRGAFQYWRMVTDDYATNFSVGYGWFSETDQARDASPDLEYTQKSWHIRFGGDRVVPVAPRAVLYVGPGFEYWSGSYESRGSGPDYESEQVSRVSLSGRVGAILLLTPSIGINCHLDARVGRARVEDRGAEAAWWPGGVDGALGVVFAPGVR